MAKKEETKPSLQDKLEGLLKENQARIAQVQQYNEQIGAIRDEINKAKEAHDYCRGQIELLQGLIAEEDKK
jgi:hypothetical protein